MPNSVDSEVARRVLVAERLRGGQLWSRVLKRGEVLRLTDVEGGASVAALFFNADQPLERYNMPDTLKAQYTAKLTCGHVLMSDMGHAQLSITADTTGWHDPLGGHGNAELVRRKYAAARRKGRKGVASAPESSRRS